MRRGAGDFPGGGGLEQKRNDGCPCFSRLADAVPEGGGGGAEPFSFESFNT